MTNKIFIPNMPITPVKPRVEQQVNKNSSPNISFKEVLQQQNAKEVKFSQHAQSRLVSRNIKLSEEQMHKLNEAVEKAANKGAKESLILMSDVALVVSIKNKTVITAVDNENIKENVFTNIDSAVIV